MYEPRPVPVADRCFAGCGRRASVIDGDARYCARCYVQMLKTLWIAERRKTNEK